MTTPDDLTAASEALLIDDLALRFAKRRTGGNVYMDGRHNPLPSEVIEAREVVALVARHVRETGCDGLREALLGLLEHHADVSCISTDADPWPEVCDEADERARAALGDRP